MRIAILVEKPSVARTLVPAAQLLFSKDSIEAVICPLFGTYAPPLPRGLAWSDYPFTAPFDVWQFEPRRRSPTSLQPGVLRLASGSDGREEGLDVALDSLSSAGRVVVAVDPKSFYHADVLLQKARGRGVAPGEAGLLYDFSPGSIRKALHPSSPEDDEKAQRLIAHGQVRHYFNHQFAVNSVAVLGKTLGVNGWVSKYQLQALYLLSESPGISPGKLLEKMARNRGTGRYLLSHEPDEGLGELGSPSSRATILAQLQAHGWAEETDRQLRLTAKGQEAVAALHPNCRDLDLPFRLHAWAEAGLPASRGAIDRYLRTFFGRQKRFGARRGARPSP